MNINIPNRNFQIGRSGWVPDIIVMHTTGNTTQSAINTITNPNLDNPVSYHFIIASGGNITRAVDISNTAFANGTSTSGNLSNLLSTSPIVRSRHANANFYTISIGFGDMNNNAGRITAAQINTAANLLNTIRADIFLRWNRWIDISRQTLIGHNEVTPLFADGSIMHCSLWSASVSFPFIDILNRFNQLPILMPFSMVNNIDGYEESMEYTSLQPIEETNNYHKNIISNETENPCCGE